MLTQEDDVEIHALAARGWTKAAIARHTGRDRKTISKYLARPRGEQRERAPSCLEPFRGYLEARFEDDPHVDATVLFRELVDAGFDRSLSDAGAGAAPAGAAAGVSGLPAPPRPGADGRDRASGRGGDPVGLAGAAESRRGASRRTCSSARCRTRGRFRAVFCEQMTFGHLAEAIHTCSSAGRHAAGCGGPTGWPRS